MSVEFAVSNLAEKPEVTTVALASMVKMISLLGAELVVGMHRDNIDLIEACIRAKLFASVEGISNEDTAAGVALAHSLVEPVLRDLRARAEALAHEQAAHPDGGKAEASAEIKNAAPSPAAARLN